MPRPFALAVILLLAASLLINYTGGATEAYITKAGRTISVNEFGVTTIADELIVNNNGTTPLETIDWGFPKSYSNRLEMLEATGPAAEVLKTERIANESSPIQWLRCRLSNPVSSGSTSEIKIRSVFSNLISLEGDSYLFTFTAYPTVPLRAEVCNSTILLPKGATPKEWLNKSFTTAEIGGRPALVGVERPLEPLSSKKISLKYSSDAQELVSFKSIRREIRIAPSGEAASRDTYQITNSGGELNSLTLPRPKNDSPILLYDSAGPLQERLQVQSDSITVQPRYGKLSRDTSFTFTLEYGLPSLDLKRVEWQGQYKFTAELASTSGYVAEGYIVNVSLPRGAKIGQSLIPPNSTSVLPDGEQILTYDFGRLPPLTTKATTIDYNYHILSQSVYPLQWIFTIELVIAAFAAAVFLKRPPKAIAAAPVEKIRRFIDLHDEKRTLRLEMKKIGEDVSRGAITRHEYRRRSKTIETRLSELNRHLAALKSDLKTIDPRYDQIAHRLERAESEIDALRASEIQMTNQYRTGRISKDVYESLTNDLRKRTEKAQETVDGIIVTLREEAR